jgi:hypothetical protein
MELLLPVAHVLSVLHDGQLLVVSCLQFHVRVTAGPVPADQREIQCCGSGMFFSDPDLTIQLVSDLAPDPNLDPVSDPTLIFLT